MQMMCADEAAITPEIELAKLALVTSKDEEDDAIAQNATITTEPGEISDNPAGPSDPTKAILKDASADTNPPNPSTDAKPDTNPEVPPPAALEEIKDVVMESRPASPPATKAKDQPDADEEMQQPEPPAATIVIPTTEVETSAADEEKPDAQADTSGDSMIVETGDEPPSDEAIIAARKKTTMVPDSGAMMFGESYPSYMHTGNY